MSKDKTSRREFFRNAAATAAVSAAATNVAKSSVYSLAPSRVIGANDKIHLGHIGLGSQGYGAHVRLLKENQDANNTQSIAISDLYKRRMRVAGTELTLPESQWYLDYRKVLDNKDIDAVVIATSDNWHARVALDAMNAGKHVYCEKPMCKTLGQAFAMYDTVKKTGRKFQVGSQGCSDPMYYKIAEIVKSGKIGKIVMGQHSYNRGDNKIGEWNSYGDNPFKAPAEGQPDHRKAGPNGHGDDYVDWDTFRKGAEPSAWDPDRFFRWRKYWEFGSGLVGDLMPHRLHPLMIALHMPMMGAKGWPRRVSSGGGLYVQKVNPDRGGPDREVPDFTWITVDFDDLSLMVMSTCVNEQGMRPMIRGNKGTIFFAGDNAELRPERAYADEVEAETVPLGGNGEPIPVHHANWFDAIRNNKETNANIDLATRVQVMISLGERAFRESKTFTFDPTTRKTNPV